MAALRFAAALLAAATSASAALPPFGALIGIDAVSNTSLGLRHCNYIASACPLEAGSDDFVFVLVPALSGAGLPAASLRSSNFPTRYLTPTGTTMQVGIFESPDVNDATWTFLPGLSDASNYSIASASKNPIWAGKYLTFTDQNTAPCHYTAPSGDVLVTDGSATEAATWVVSTPPPPPPTVITINAANVTHEVNPLFIGCHVDPGYTQEPRGWYSQLVYGESFEKGTTSVYAWNNVTSVPNGTASLDASVTFNPNNPVATLQLSYGAAGNEGSDGIVGWSNRGIGNEGMSIEGGKAYDGYVFVLAPAGTQLFVAINDYVANQILDSAVIDVPASGDWQQVNFNLNPIASTSCAGITPGSNPSIDCGRDFPTAAHICVQCSGELQVGIAAPGTAHIGYVFFEPGPWGRLGEQPVLLSAVQTMQEMGTRVIRQGGTVSQSFKWKDWRGVPWERGSMQHVWGQSLVSGWGPFEFVDMCNALDIVPVLTLAWDLQSVEDWADLVEYAWGDDTTTWGRVRIYNDSHPAPYNFSIVEIGNEQTSPLFAETVIAMEARRATIPGAPQWRYMYPHNSAIPSGDAANLTANGISPSIVMPDCHVGGGGGVNCAVSDFNSLPGFEMSFINCETNAGLSNHQRAMQEASDLQIWFNFGANAGEDPARLVARTASFCTERSGHYDAFDQGISFFLPNMTWLMPPGYVHKMISQAWQPRAVAVNISNPSSFQASAQVSDDGSALTVQIVNDNPSNGTVTINLSGFAPVGAVVVRTLANDNLQAVNTPAQPAAVAPVETLLPWPANGSLQLQLPSFSFTVLQATTGAAATA